MPRNSATIDSAGSSRPSSAARVSLGTSDLRFEIEGAVASPTFHRSRARDAMTWELYEGLVRACEHVHDAMVRRTAGVGAPLRREGGLRGGDGQIPAHRVWGADEVVVYDERMVRVIGPARTRGLLLTARPFGAEEAPQIGLASGEYAADELPRRGAALAKNAPSTPRATKDGLRRWDAPAATIQDADLLQLRHLSRDVSERVGAVLRKRAPAREGR